MTTILIGLVLAATYPPSKEGSVAAPTGADTLAGLAAAPAPSCLALYDDGWWAGGTPTSAASPAASSAKSIGELTLVSHAEPWGLPLLRLRQEPPTSPNSGGDAPVNFQLLRTPPPTAAAVQGAVAYQAATAGDRWRLMRELQGTWLGAMLDDERMYVYGWLQGSYNASSAAETNTTVTWNERANKFLLQQAWTRIGRSVVTSGTTEPTVGFQVDILAGSDYRYTMVRGLWNSQLLNAEGVQSLYGVDLPQAYVNLYVPTLFRGVEFRVGRVYCPWGVESIEAPSTPLPTHSYAFNWCPPFTHCGIGAYITLSPEWSTMLMATNGNDVFFGDPSAEWRFVGNVKWTQPGGGRNTVQVSTSVGRGKFNANEVFAAPTFATITEPGGRNNINVFDVVWTHLFNSRLSYNLEGIYGYQTNVPALANAAGGGTAHWWSAAHYLFCTMSSQITGIARFETFDDVQGQRTGFEGLYVSSTLGCAYKPAKDVIIRPEIRYDYNLQNRPFEGKHGILVGTVDLVLRW